LLAVSRCCGLFEKNHYVNALYSAFNLYQLAHIVCQFTIGYILRNISGTKTDKLKSEWRKTK